MEGGGQDSGSREFKGRGMEAYTYANIVVITMGPIECESEIGGPLQRRPDGRIDEEGGIDVYT